jgi:transposase-like protein
MATNFLVLEEESPYNANPKERWAAHWTEFERLYPTDEECWRELYLVVKKWKSFDCSRCGSDSLERLRGRMLKCTRCGRVTSFTRGTFLAHIKRPRAWHCALWMTQRGVALSSSKLHRLVGVSQSSALAILHAVRTVILEHMGEAQYLVSSALFAQAIYKRSMETPARKHPTAEQEEMEQEEAEAVATFTGQEMSQSKSPAYQPSELEEMVLQELSEKPVTIEFLCDRTGIALGELMEALTILELESQVNSVPGACYVRSQEPKNKPPDSSSTEIKEAVNAAMDFICLHFHGVSRKYLQKYLAAYWLWNDTTHSLRETLIDQCIRFGPPILEDVFAYVSPPLVRLRA